jgi:integrase
LAWPRKVTVGRVSVTVYRRKTPHGNWAFMLADYSEGPRRFRSYAKEAEALEAANKLARQLSEHDTIAASLTDSEALHLVAAARTVEQLGVSLQDAVSTFAQAFKIVGDTPTVITAANFYAARHKRTTPKRVADVVAELLAVKEKRGASARYLQDLRYRLGRVAEAFQKDTCNVTTADLQAWLDAQKLAPQSYQNFRRVANLLFEFAAARGYAADNPVEGVESVKVNARDVDIFTPDEMARLLAAASPDFLPALAIGAFAGLRSAEIERLEWSDVHFAEKCLIVGASKAKTASRRVVPLHDNLAAWLADYAERKGSVWPGGKFTLYDAQQETAKAAGVPWKANALRHSYASYRFAQTGDAGRVAGELGNSAAVVHKHYRELVKPADAERWFSIKPEAPANVVSLAAEAAHA